MNEKRAGRVNEKRAGRVKEKRAGRVHIYINEEINIIYIYFKETYIYTEKYFYQDIRFTNDIYNQSYIYTQIISIQSYIHTQLSGVRVGNATRVAATVTEMRVALTEMRRRAGVSGQTPSRGTPCPGRLSGRPVQGLLPTGTLLRFFQLLGPLVRFGRGHGFHCWSHSAKIGCRQ